MSLTQLDLAALLASRICHDLISPVAAFSTGLEVLEEESDEDMRRHAFDLLSTSSKQSTARLEYLRLAFGAAGGLGSELDFDEARRLAEGYFPHLKPDLVWSAAPGHVTKAACKIALNLCLIGAESIPRGGEVCVQGDGRVFIVVKASGPRAKLIDATKAALDGKDDALDAKSVQPYLVGLLVREAQARLSYHETDENVTIRVDFASS